MPSKTLVLTSCCKEKLSKAAPAKDLYMGKLFTLVKQYAEETGSDWRILSAKHGLINPDQIIEPYDLQITGRAQIEPLQETVLPALAAIWDNYERIIVIMGAQYLKVINPILKRQGKWKLASNVKVEEIHDERGIGGLMQKVKELIRLAKIPSIRWCHFHPVQQCKYWGCSCSTCEFRPPPTPEFFPTSEEIELKIPRPETSRDYVQGYYTRIQRPDLCSACPHRTDSFNPKRHAALNNGNDNPASTACDYCCVWDDLLPDHLPCSHCGESGHLRRLENAIVCDNCHKDHELLEAKPMAEQPKPNTEKKDEQYGPLCGKCETVIPAGTPGMEKDSCTGRWLHPACIAKPTACEACGKADGTLRQDCIAKKWLCEACWQKRPTAEKPLPEKPAKKVRKKKAEKDPYDDGETPDNPYEKWPISGDGKRKTLKQAAMERHLFDPATDMATAAELARRLREADARRKKFLQKIADAKIQGRHICPVCDQDLDPMSQGFDCPTGVMVHGFHMDKTHGDKIAADALKEYEEIETVIAAVKPASGTEVPVCPTCHLPQTEYIYSVKGGFKRCTCKTPENKAWAGSYLYLIFSNHAAEIVKSLSEKEQEDLNVLGEVLESA